jgi:nucleoid-associated protein YgaU
MSGLVERDEEFQLLDVHLRSKAREGADSSAWGSAASLTGDVASQEEKEKILLAMGNIEGVGSVDDQITVTGPVVVAAKFVTVVKGDTLSAISLRVYGDANKYQKIFDANKPMLKDVNKIYPGQSLRIPE